MITSDIKKATEVASLFLMLIMQKEHYQTKHPSLGKSWKDR